MDMTIEEEVYDVQSNNFLALQTASCRFHLLVAQAIHIMIPVWTGDAPKNSQSYDLNCLIFPSLNVGRWQ